MTHETNAQHCVFTSFPSCFMCLQITGRIECFCSTSSFVFYTVIICKVYIYIYIYIYIYTHFPLPSPNVPEVTFFSYLATFCERFRLLRVVLEIY